MPDSPLDLFGKIASSFARLRPDKGGDEDQMARTPRRQGSIQLAYSRPDDPMFYWRQNNIPFDIWGPDSTALQKAQEYSRVLYITHPVIGSAIDIYSKYPLAGMEIAQPKDPSLGDFYKSLFFDDLDYEAYLANVGREHWMVGEAFPMGSFNDLMGIWDDDELILPTDCLVERSMFSREPILKMRLPSHIMQILRMREPLDEYRRIVESYPELLGWVTNSEEAAFFQVSNDILYHFKRDADAFHPRGIPILMRAFRAVVQEEMLNAAQDGIASRLYTPLVLAKIGATASDLGTTQPWIPDQADLDAFSDQVNAALAADFRMITTHFAVDINSVFGRESVPDMSRDFDRLEEKMLMAFGLSKTMLSGASGGDTYAADALNRDLISQILGEYQRKIKRMFRRRCEVVAEAQGHYDYEMKGGKPKPIMEEYLELDPETGDQRIVTRPKLLLPELRIKSMNMKDDDNFHKLLETLRAAGIPISQRARLVNVDVDLADEEKATMEEQVSQAVFAQRVRKQTYIRLRAENLPVPDDLREDFEPKAREAPGQEAAAAGALGAPAVPGALGPDGLPLDPNADVPIDGLGTTAPDTTTLAPVLPITTVPRNRARPLTEHAHRPPESDEMRAGMPRASSRRMASFDPDELAKFDFDTAPAHIALSDDELVALGQVDDDDDYESPDPAPLGSARVAHVGLRHESIFYKHEIGADDE